MPSLPNLKAAIVIPSYNEKDNLPKLIPAIFKELSEVFVIVVDDNSPDNTAEVVRKLQKRFDRLHLVERKGKGGRGSAVIAGFNYGLKNLNADKFLEMDADFSHNPKELPEILNKVNPNTVVLASRYMKGGAWVDCPPKRVITSKLGNWLIRTVLELPFKDNTNGLRAYPKEAVKILNEHQFVSHSYIVLSESAKLLQLKGFKIIETPSIFINRQLGKSNTTLKEFLTSFRALMKIRNHLQRMDKNETFKNSVS